MFSVFWRCLKYLIQQQHKLCPMTNTFDRLPYDVVGIILGNLRIGHRVRLRLVSKSWRDRLVRSDFPVKPEPPWLILPIDSYDKPSFLSNQISFESMSEKRTYRFNLLYDPFCSSAGWYCWCCCGSSSDGGSWLLMAGYNSDHDLSSTAMILWDPISGTTKRLPALSTLPFFGELVDTCTREGLDMFCSPRGIARAQVFSVGSVECVVAVVFSENLGPNLHRLALCSPQEQSWSVVPWCDGPDREHYKDILFHDGHLYTICKVTLAEDTTRRPGVIRSSPCTVRLSCCDVQVTKLEIVYDKKHRPVYENIIPLGFWIRERWNVVEHLVRSSAGGGVELLVVSAVLDDRSCSGGRSGPIEPNAYSLTSGFEVYGLDRNGVCCFERLRHYDVGKQCIFVGATGSTSVEAAAGDDYCKIHFATNDADGIYWINEEQYEYKWNVVHERGVFDVARDKIERTHWKYLHYDTRSCVGWFTPKLWS